MRTAAIYARYSTDEQRPTSIEDQVRQCRELAESKGFEVEDRWIFVDSAISGGAASSHKRTSFQGLLDAIDAREVDVLFIDEVSRVTRNQLDGARVADYAVREGLRIVSCDGIDSADKNWQFLWGFKVLSAVQQNQSTADEVVRSMVGQLERGFQIAQPPYGYVGVRERAKDGRGGTHWVIDSPTAAVVVQMYNWRHSGLSLLEIAQRLNAAKIPCPGHRRVKPGAGFWRPGTVFNVLANTAYKGVFVWRGSQYTKAKAKRMRQMVTPKPYERPDLRLVSDELWAACNPSAGQESIRGGGKHALSRVVRCGYCQAALSIGGSGKTGYHASCPQCEQARRVNGATYFIGYTSLRAVKFALRWALEQVFSGEVLEEFRQRLRTRLTEGPAQEEALLQSRVQELEAGMDRVQRLLLDPNTPVDWLRSKLAELNTDLEKAKKMLGACQRRSSKVTRDAVEAQVQIDPLPLIERLMDGEPVAYKVRVVLQRLIARFHFVERKGRGKSVFEIEFRPGAFVAEQCGGDVLDSQSVTFRIEVSASAARPVVWHVAGVRL